MKIGDAVEIKVGVGSVLPISGTVTVEHWVSAVVKMISKDGNYIVAQVVDPAHEWNDLNMTCDSDHYRAPA